MGALAIDTAVELVNATPGAFRAHLARDWETWGPNGGYLASIALRAAGAATVLPRPATFTCLFLGVGTFDDAEIVVTSLRASRRSEALRVSITQGDRVLLEAHVWAVDDGLSGLQHDVAIAPDVAGPPESNATATPPLKDRHKFWSNFDVESVSNDAGTGSTPELRQWMRFVPHVRHDDDLWLDACRSVVLLDTMQWPAAARHHLDRDAAAPAFIAPNIDLSIRFHRSIPTSDWLLVDACSPVAAGGLMTGEARIWSDARHLIASGSSHLLCREVPLGTPGSGTTAR